MKEQFDYDNTNTRFQKEGVQVKVLKRGAFVCTGKTFIQFMKFWGFEVLKFWR